MVFASFCTIFCSQRLCKKARSPRVVRISPPFPFPVSGSGVTNLWATTPHVGLGFCKYNLKILTILPRPDATTPFPPIVVENNINCDRDRELESFYLNKNILSVKYEELLLTLEINDYLKTENLKFA
jgi:hypothetical protein